MKIVLIITFTSILLTAQQPGWRIANGTEGKSFYSIAIFPNNPDTIFAAGFDGFFRSTDNGEHWDSISSLGSFIPIGGDALKVDLFNPNIIYSSTLGFSGNNVNVSSDGGLNWSLKFIGIFCQAPFVEIDPKDKKTVYVGINPPQIWHSSDYGLTWDSLPIPFIDCINDFEIAPSNDSIMYTAYSFGIFKSTDKGNSWIQLPFIGPYAHYLEIDPRNPDIVYAATEDLFGPPGGVYKTTDGGLSWEEKNNGLSYADRDINDIEINPKNSEELFIGTTVEIGSSDSIGVFKTTDGGYRWIPFDDGIPGGIAAFATDTINNRLFAIGVGVYIFENLISSNVEEYLTIYNIILDQNYPNPFNNYTTIRYTLEKSNFVKLSVYDILGKEVKLLVNEYQPSGSYQTELNFEGLPSGLYLYRLEAGEQSLVRKAILLK
ncbi:MAG TPA: T9SS type A sorting domain-containing protein [Ignavibacteriaceae bacterium]|nr:T9SS type A sorting domain-containing protein [Ignavibacteriaceae bacterium]